MDITDYCQFDQIIPALMSIKCLFQKTFKNLTDTKPFNSIQHEKNASCPVTM